MTPSAPPDVRVFPDPGTMSRAAAELFVSFAQQNTASHNRFTVVLSGGSTPKQLYGLLASPRYRQAVAWRKVHVFWADERCVPPDHPESNYKLAFDTFLSGVPAQNIHRIQGEEEPDAAALTYEAELHAFFGTGIPVFDLVLLGAGEDGHTASLLPGSAAVRERRRLALPVYVDPPRPSRVTLTLPVLNNASQVLFLIAGRTKAGVVHEIMEDGNPKEYPAGLVNPVHGNVTWMLDRDACAMTGFFMQKHG